MNHIQFLAYNNRVIRFKLKDSIRFKKGVILDVIDYGSKKYSTHYSFITLRSLNKWKLAYKNGNKTIMRRLENEIDIKKILKAEVLNSKTYKPLEKQPIPFKLIN